ncbi:MAG TPA: hypothetical protein PLJ21_03040, partial [Pseudobdellovibrionaceae bacterium]|nr:hypothetical protein [Pseudobdellovibrionaceae bacterium]
SANLQRCREVNIFLNGLRKMATQMTDIGLQEEGLLTLAQQRHELIENTLSKFGPVTGASLQMLYSMDIANSVKSYQELNSNLNVSFQPISLSKVEVYFNKATPKDKELPMVINNGIPLSGDLKLTAGQSFSGWVDLSLFGACPLKDPFDDQLPKKLRAKDLSAVMVPNLYYEYNVGGTYKYTAKFKKSGIARKIKEQTSRGGFFSTSGINKILEDRDTKGWFDLQMDCDDPRVCERLKMETALQIKQRLVVEILDQITLSKIGIPLPEGIARPPRSNGAQVAAQGLRENCQHIYCQVGSVVLDVGNSTFGNTTSIDEFINSHEDWVEESVNQTIPVNFSGTQGFQGENPWN